MSDARKLASVRKEIITYCESLPQFIRTHGRDSVGWLSLQLGKCLLWIGPTLDQYSLVQPMPGQTVATVSTLGEELRVIGLQLIQTPSNGDLQRTIETLKRQVELLESLTERSAQ